MKSVFKIAVFVFTMVLLQGIVSCRSVDSSGCTRREQKKANKLMEKAWVKCPDEALKWSINRVPPKIDTVETQYYVQGETFTNYDTTVIRDTINKTITKIVYKDRLRVDTFVKKINVNTTDNRELLRLKQENERLKSTPKKFDLNGWVIGLGLLVFAVIGLIWWKRQSR